MPDHIIHIEDEQAAIRLAVRLCREVYLLTTSGAHKWILLKELEKRLDAHPRDLQAALRYCSRLGWIDGFGAPPIGVTLLPPGRALFDKADVALPRR